MPWRVMPHLRFLNAKTASTCRNGSSSARTTDVQADRHREQDRHALPSRAARLGGPARAAQQKLCYNEIPTKVNWHYVRFDFDLATMQATDFQCNDRVFDLSTFDSIRIPAMRNLWCMLNLGFFVETDTDKRAFVYLDSVCLSGDF